MFDGFFDPTTGIGSIVSFLLGFLLKRYEWIRTKFIPIAVFVVSFLTQLINHLGDPEPVAMLSGGYFTAGFFDGAIFKILMQAVLQTFLVVGAHSGPKNVIEGVQDKEEEQEVEEEELEDALAKKKAAAKRK